MNIPKLSLYDFLRARHVKRWHIVETSRAQTVAEHSWLVTVIALELNEQLKALDGDLTCENEEILQLIGHAMFHDTPEIRTGDIPTPGKALLRQVNYVDGQDCDLFEATEQKLMPEIPYIGGGPDSRSLRIVKMADQIEAYAFITECGLGENSRYVSRLNRQALEARVEKYTVDEGSDWYGPVNRVLNAYGLPPVIRELRLAPP